MSEEKQQQDTAVAEAPAEAADGDNVTRLEAEVAALKDQLLRALADQENARRRAARERDDAVRFAASGLAADLLPTLDSLRRAIESVPEEQAAADEATRNLLAGVAMIERALLAALEKQGVRQLDLAPGDRFDPNRHHAMFEVDDSEYPAGSIAQIVQPGYAYHDRLLRPALVGVAQARRGDDGGTAETTTSGGAAETG
ncbi:MAG TPA: nucleotide exchange factor GrpE [Stellaceae bacterium]